MQKITNKFSIIIPIFNEKNNIEVLLNQILENISQYNDFEIIFVDDASTDDSLLVLKKYKKNSFIKVISHYKNFGQSKALWTGIKIAKYDNIVTLDGDCQNDPADIPKLLKIYFKDKDLKLIGGLRLKRNDSFIKIFSSKLANRIRSFILKDNCIDTGCSLKVFKKDIFLNFPFFDGIHRFLPALFKGYGYKTFFISVNHRYRLSGKSKYGTLKRLYRGIFDLIRVKKIIAKKNVIKF